MADTQIDYDKLAEANVRAMKSAGMGTGGGGGFTGVLGEGLTKATTSLNPFNSALSVGGKVIQGFESTYTALHGVIAPSLKTWRDLSNTGQAFGGDIVAMSTAAFSARLNLDEFADVINKSGHAMTGLGGVAGRGAEAFAQVSKEFFDSNLTNDMRALGYTNKELNDVLAITMSSMQTIDMNDKASRQRAYEAASGLAKEMDAMAKITGVTRKQQEEAMEDARRDMALNARIDLETRNMSAKDAEAYRLKVYEQVKDAQLRGEEAAFKERFATGTVYSEKAAAQTTMLGKQSMATQMAADAARRGEFEKAKEYQSEAQVQVIANSKNVGLLMNRIMGDAGGVATKTLNENMAKNQDFVNATRNAQLKLENEGKLKGLSEDAKNRAVYNQMLKDGFEPPKTKEGGEKSTQALLNLEAQSKTLGSSFMNDLVTPLNRKVSPAMDTFANKLNGTVIRPDGTKSTVAREAREGAIAGRTEKPTTGTRQERIDAASNTDQNSMIFNTMEGASKIVNGLGNVINKATEKAIPGQAEGSKDTFGDWFNKDWGGGGLSMLHGKEAVVPQAKLGEFMNDMQKQMGGGIGGLTNIAKGFDPSQMQRMVVDQLRNIPKPEVPQPQVPQAQSVAQNTNTSGGKDANLNDAVSLLEQLNKQMGELISHTENIADNSSKQVRVTKGLSNNKFA
jgi:hypothetical protein